MSEDKSEDRSGWPWWLTPAGVSGTSLAPESFCVDLSDDASLIADGGEIADDGLSIEDARAGAWQLHDRVLAEERERIAKAVTKYEPGVPIWNEWFGDTDSGFETVLDGDKVAEWLRDGGKVGRS